MFFAHVMCGLTNAPFSCTPNWAVGPSFESSKIQLRSVGVVWDLGCFETNHVDFTGGAVNQKLPGDSL